jgi:ABC-type bacteriocin/lantibiotic exporter with double-glycine peptidase domain
MKAIRALYSDVLAVLPAGARRYVIQYSLVLALLSILDGAALGLLALVITPLVSGAPLKLPIIGTIEGTGQAIVLGLVCVLVIAKSVLAVVQLWVTTRKFQEYELAIGARLFGTYIASPWTERLKRNSADLVRVSETSVAQMITSFLLPAATVPGELLSFIAIIAVLAIAQPVIAIVTLLYIGLLGAVLFFVITRRVRQAARVNMSYSLKTSRLLTEMVGALKEVTLRNKLDEIADVVLANRRQAIRARSNIRFLGQVPRYALDAGLIGGFLLVGVAGFFITGLPGAVGGLPGALTAVALFGLAGFRMAPSVVRFQAVVAGVTANAVHARAVLEEISRSETASAHLETRTHRDVPEDPHDLVFEKVSFRYAPEAEDAVRDVSLTIPFGSTVAFVGSSGAGKSTMIDLILGLIEPTGGRITIDGVPLEDVTTSWRSRVGYVPQEVSLFDATVAENVALSWTGTYDRKRVTHALRQAQLLKTIEARPGGIDGEIGERGLALSGGQRQRLGIARALYAEPLVLVMDEATSALDTSTEAAVSDAIKTLGGTVTIITVAHRLSTVMHSDRIFFMSGGTLVAHGTFAELVKQVPEFAAQAGLAGLVDGDSSTG